MQSNFIQSEHVQENSLLTMTVFKDMSTWINSWCQQRNIYLQAR